MSERLLCAAASATAGWPRRVGFVIFPGFQLLDLTGPLAVFDAASRLGGREPSRGAFAYPSLVLAATAGAVKSSAGLEVTATGSYGGGAEELDTLVVVGGEGSRRAAEDAALIAWLRAMAPNVRRLGSICTGAFVLAAAGLLDGRRATTHWASCSALASRYPAIDVDADAIYVRDGKFFASAGVTAGMDLALALVEEDCGRALALAVARWLVMFVKRPGGQSQFSAQLAAQGAAAPAIVRLQEWALAHLADDLSVPALAARAAMSGRNFARVFLSETGATPGDFVENARLEAARRLLEESDHALERVAREAGFGNADRLRRAFLRRLGVTPLDYRRRFRFSPAPAPRGTAQQEGAIR
ncbi:MAG TPA: GlxA family transcriptional regulator [Alphaproteobacteria bacterium]|nr:GlxA family transcriptional regulator [Alphaproteobacteria bacterium]